MMDLGALWSVASMAAHYFELQARERTTRFLYDPETKVPYIVIGPTTDEDFRKTCEVLDIQIVPARET